MNRHIPYFFALSSYRPDGKHFFMADYDNKVVIPRRAEFMYETQPHHYHIIDFTARLTLAQLVYRLKLFGADAGFIRWVEKNGYAQLRISNDFTMIQEGIYPTYRLRFMEVKFVHVAIKPIRAT